jgi:hypothetical protein
MLPCRGFPGAIPGRDIMTIRFTGAMVGGVLFAMTTTGFAQTAGSTPSAPASSAAIAEHAAATRAEALFMKCRQHYGVVVDGVLWPGAPNSRYAACMRSGGRRI